jgi:predicted transporter
MSYVYAAVIGILIGIFIFGLKTGVGCGFSTVKKKDVLILASGYFLISVILGSLVEMVDQSYLEGIASLGMTLHVFIALVLIGAGIYTQKKWNCGHDVSKKTFLVISVPCPVCPVHPKVDKTSLIYYIQGLYTHRKKRRHHLQHSNLFLSKLKNNWYLQL